MRIALSKILALNPDVLLMDEPTNHLDLESIVWLESWIKAYKGILLMTSHDRDFMNGIVSKIIEVANQTITTYSGNYDFYEKERDIRKVQLVAAARRQDEMLAKEEEFIARFAARASHAAQVQSRVKKIDKIERIEIPTEEKAIDFQWQQAPRGGDEVVRFENLGKVWDTNGKQKLVFNKATGLVKRRDRVAVVGVNGAGKSTLLKMISGFTEPTEGKLNVGPSIELGYFSQSSIDVLNTKNTILEEVHSRIPNSSIGSVRMLLGALKFSGEEVEKKISILSGGEKSRVVLATILAKPINFLVLDEPTNHLDIQSREVLLEAIKSFDGTVMIDNQNNNIIKTKKTKKINKENSQNEIYEGSWDYFLEKTKATN